MRAIGIGIPFGRRSGGVDAQAQAHFDRVIADGGLVPSGLSGVNAFFNTIKTIYGTSDINTAISVGLDPQVLGYKLGAGSGTTLGQAAQKLYSPKDVFGGIGTGNAYWEGSGVTGNFVQSNTSAYNTNDIDIEVQASTVATTGDVSFVNISNGTSTTVDFFYSKTNGVIQFQYYTGGFRNSFAVATIADGDIFRVTRNATTGSIVFRKNGIILTTSGAQVAGVLDFVNTTIKIGQGVCKINYANFYIAGVLNKTFNPNQYTGANTWTSTTSEVWTVNRTGAGLADVVQTTAASQPLLLVHEGANYWFSVQAAGNSVSSTTSYATSNIDVEFSVNNQISSDSTPVSGGSGGNPWRVIFNSGASAIQLEYYSGGYRVASASTTLTGNNTWRVTRNSTTGSISFIRNGVTLTTTGSQVAGALDSLPTSLFVGNLGSGANGLQGRINSVKFYISNVVTRDFNPNQYNPSTSQTQWTSSTGEVWTINKDTAASGFTGQLVYKTLVKFGGDAQGKSFSPNTSIQVNQPDTIYTAFNFDVFNSFQGVYDSNTATTRQSMSNDNLSGRLEVFAGAPLLVSGTNQNAIRLITSVYNSTNSSIQINNGTATNGNVGTQRIDGLRIGVLANSPPTFSLKGNIFTLLISNSANNATIRTEIYNYLRSINNNAF